MDITYGKAGDNDRENIYALCRDLILSYETAENIDIGKVLEWEKHKTENGIDGYTAVYADGIKAGYYRFFENGEGFFEIDDLFVFPEFRGRGIGTAVIEKCCSSVSRPVILYVFKKNERAVSLYRKLGFEIIRVVNGTRYIMRRQKK